MYHAAGRHADQPYQYKILYQVTNYTRTII